MAQLLNWFKQCFHEHHFSISVVIREGSLIMKVKNYCVGQ